MIVPLDDMERYMATEVLPSDCNNEYHYDVLIYVNAYDLFWYYADQVLANWFGEEIWSQTGRELER